MLRVYFNLKSPKKEASLIIARCTFNGARIVYSTGLRIPSKFWNNNSRTVRSNAHFKDGHRITLGLRAIENAFNQAEEYFFFNNSTPTVKSFKDKLKELLEPSKTVPKEINNNGLTFNTYLDQFIERRKASLQYRPESIKVYKTVKAHFEKFSRYRQVEFEDLTVQYIIDFIDYLHRKAYSDNHVHKIISTLRTVLNQATDDGANKNMSYKNRRIKAPKREADNVYLTPVEIKRLSALELKGEKEITRDLFVIGCYTGLRYSDYSSLNGSNIVDLANGNKAFRVIVFKTNEILWIPIHPAVERILQKYEYNLPEGTCNQVMNRFIKDICKKARIDEYYMKRMFRTNKAEVTKFKKHELVSTHTARRSFATNAYKAKVPMLSIMKITGHKKTETFQKYISLSNEEHAELMSSNSFFTEEVN